MAAMQEQAQWTLKRLLQWTTDYFSNAGVDQPRLSGELLLAEVLDCQRIELYTRFDYCPDAEELARYRDYVKRAADHEPIAYILGTASFYSRSFDVGSGCLIPRPETELLIDQAVAFLKQLDPAEHPAPRVLDLGTGSGCIALTLAAECPTAEVTATDISPEALAWANRNAQRHELDCRVRFLEGDLFASLDREKEAGFDLIVSNPPYIAEAEYEQLDRHIRDHEPRLALCPGHDGTETIGRILQQGEPFLAEHGRVMVEIAWNQAPAVTTLCQQAGYLQDWRVLNDFQGHPRLLVAGRHGLGESPSIPPGSGGDDIETIGDDADMT